MSRIQKVVDIINISLKSHYFKDIDFKGIATVIEKDGKKVNTIYKGFGDSDVIGFNDINGLNVWHKIISVSSDEDYDNGFGNNVLSTETYSMKIFFFGNQRFIKDIERDINYDLSDEFKKYFPRFLNKQQCLDINCFNTTISTKSVNFDKQNVSSEESEGVNINPENVMFSIDYDVEILYLENCKSIEC